MTGGIGTIEHYRSGAKSSVPRGRLAGAFGLVVLAAVALSPCAVASAQGSSVLKWKPGSGTNPSIQVRVDSIFGNDVALPGPGLGAYWDFGSLPDTFAHRDEAARTSFQNTFQHYINHNQLHPAVSQPPNPTVRLHTYRKPYEFNQAEFLNWLHTHTTRTDFLEPAARGVNDYLGNLISPLAASEADVSVDVLKKTFGQVAIFKDGSVTLLNDNKYNPTRWMSPINEIHHKEQAGLCIVLPSDAGKFDETSTVLQQFMSGDKSQHIFLEYDIEVEAIDQRAEMNEYTIYDVFGGVAPQDSQFLHGIGLRNALLYGSGASSPNGEVLHPLLQASAPLWIDRQLVPVNMQVSIMVNWLERASKYRLSEFTIASKNRQPVNYYPPYLGADGFKPTANDTLNAYITDGGNSGNTSWHRSPISLLSNPDFTSLDPNLLSVVVQGGEFKEIPDGNSQNRFHGIIDLTNYYALARAQSFFPGQRGYWVNEWVGFEGDNPAYQDANEQHGIEWLGLVFENHGPCKLRVKSNKLNIYIAPNATLVVDLDGDRLNDINETRDLDPNIPGIQNPFDPNIQDSTGDNGQATPDGITDGANDWDGDGVSNATEFLYGSNPINPTSIVQLPATGHMALWVLSILLLIAALVTIRLLRRNDPQVV